MARSARNVVVRERKPIPRVGLEAGEAQAITDARLAIRANGWPGVIKGHGKSCRVLRWNYASTAPTEDDIRSWLHPRAGQTKFPTTNLLIDRGLIALDFDIGDRDLMDETWRIALSIAPQLAGAPIRGRDDGSPKILAALRRAGEPFTLDSGKWSREPDNKAAPTAMIEVFGSERHFRGFVRRQIGLLGPHSVTEKGEVTIRYQWRGPSPVDTAFAAVPEIGITEAEAIVREFRRLVVGQGLGEVVRAVDPRIRRPKRVFDIAAGTVFSDEDGCTFTVDELEDLIRREDKDARVMITGSFTNDPSSSGSNRCLCSIGQHGLTIWDSKTNTTHLIADRKPVEDDMLAKLWAQLYGGGAA